MMEDKGYVKCTCKQPIIIWENEDEKIFELLHLGQRTEFPITTQLSARRSIGRWIQEVHTFELHAQRERK